MISIIQPARYFVAKTARRSSSLTTPAQLLFKQSFGGRQVGVVLPRSRSGAAFILCAEFEVRNAGCDMRCCVHAINDGDEVASVALPLPYFPSTLLTALPSLLLDLIHINGMVSEGLQY